MCSKDSCGDDCNGRSDKQENMVVDKSGVANVITRIEVGNTPGPNCLRERERHKHCF